LRPILEKGCHADTKSWHIEGQKHSNYKLVWRLSPYLWIR
jgi:hypothetical protein